MMTNNYNQGFEKKYQKKNGQSTQQMHQHAPHIAPPVNGSFRSAAEAQLNSGSKFRQLPCKTLIATGACPYGERCVFLHDTRLLCHKSHSISRMKNKEDTVVDAFFWPVTALENVFNKKTDHNFRPYAVPMFKNDQYKLHDQALFSIWNHYVEYCRTSTRSQKPSVVSKAMHDTPINSFTQESRLPVFQLLSSSNGHEITTEQFLCANFTPKMDTPASSASHQPVQYQQQQVQMQSLPPPLMQRQAAVQLLPQQQQEYCVHQRISSPPLQQQQQQQQRAQFQKQYSPSGVNEMFYSFENCSPEPFLVQQQQMYAEEHPYDLQHHQQLYAHSHSHDSSCHTSLTSKECGYSNPVYDIDYEAVEKMAREDCDSISVLSDDSYQLSM